MNLNHMVIGVAGLLSGCIALPIPHERHLSPVYYGVVTDADTGKLIESVAVSVGGHLYSKQPTSGETRTDAAGRYEAVAKDKAYWFVLMLAPATSNCGGTLLFVHPDYEMRLESTDQPSGGGSDWCAGIKRRLNVSLKKKNI